MHQLVDEPELQGLLGADVLPGKNQIQGVAETNAARQTLRSARTRNESQLNLRQSENGLRMIGGDTIPARECRLQSAAQTSTMNRRNHWYAKILHRVQKHLSVSAQALSVGGGLELKKFLNVGAGDPDVGFAADEYRRMNGGVAVEAGDERDKLVFDRAAEFVHGLVRQIESDDRDTIGYLDGKRGTPARPD